MPPSADLTSLRERVWIKTLVLFLACMTLGAVLVWLAESNRSNALARTATELSVERSQAIQQGLGQALSATYTLAELIRQGNGSIQRFDEIAAQMLLLHEGVSALQLAPDAVVQQVVPLAGNERAIGHRALDDARQSSEARMAIETGKLTLAGPLDLVQGGRGLVGRLPVFLDGDQRAPQFWGFASALISIDDLLQIAALDSLKRQGFDYELWRRDPVGGGRDIIARSSARALGTRQELAFSIPNGQWMLRVEPVGGWTNATTVGVEILLVLLLGTLITAGGNRLFRQPLILRREVLERTRELSELSDSLRQSNARLSESEQHFRHLHDEIRQLAFHDSLTRLPNRRVLADHLALALATNRHTFAHGALIFIDLDKFKHLNDTHGHDAGDALLVEVAQRLKACLREMDTVARLGGDEFVVLLSALDRDPGVARAQAAVVADKICALLAQPYALQTDASAASEGPGATLAYTIAASIGVTLFSDFDHDGEAVLKRADAAMYVAKRAGGNQVAFSAISGPEGQPSEPPPAPPPAPSTAP